MKKLNKVKFTNGNFNLICFFVFLSCFSGFFADEKFICNEQGNHLFNKKTSDGCDVVFHSFLFSRFNFPKAFSIVIYGGNFPVGIFIVGFLGFPEIFSRCRPFIPGKF
jgi:hypothetical protein